MFQPTNDLWHYMCRCNWLSKPLNIFTLGVLMVKSQNPQATVASCCMNHTSLQYFMGRHRQLLPQCICSHIQQTNGVWSIFHRARRNQELSWRINSIVDETWLRVVFGSVLLYPVLLNSDRTAIRLTFYIESF